MSIRIAHITDLHLDEDYPHQDHSQTRVRFDRVLESIKSEGITHLVCTGDIGENEGVTYFFDQLKDMTLAIALGNHDHFDTISAYYPTYADHKSKKLYGSTEIHNHQVIYLDSSEGLIDNKQLIWLQQELEGNLPAILFMHHPIIGLKYKVDEIGRLANREEIMPILRRSNKQINVYCGHYHMESVLVLGNVTQYITPAVSFQIKKRLNVIEIDTTSSGYRTIELDVNQQASQVHLLENAD
jgi:Icc protein